MSAATFPQTQPSSFPAIPYQSVPDFLKLPPDLYLGEVAGVAVNSKGHVFVFSRGGSTGPAYGAAAAQLLEFDGQGNYIREIGHHLYAWSYAHAVKVVECGVKEQASEDEVLNLLGMSAHSRCSLKLLKIAL